MKHYFVFLILLCCSWITYGQTGYIYVHETALNEESSVDFPFTGTGGITGFSLNDQEDYGGLVDLGAGTDRLWAIAGATGGSGNVSQGFAYYRQAGTSNWVLLPGGLSTYSSVDGGTGNTAALLNSANAEVYYYNGSTIAQYSSGAGAVDVAIDKINGRILYVKSDGHIFWKPVATTGTGGWTQVGTIANAARIDAAEITGAAQPILYRDNTFKHIYTTTYTGTPTTDLGIPGGVANNLTFDVTMAADGAIYTNAVVSIPGGGDLVAYHFSSGSWLPEVAVRGMTNVTGGANGQVWGVQANGLNTILTRVSTNLWIDDERVRVPLTGNAVMIPVAAGSYTITEGTVAGWALQSIDIYDPTANSTASVTSRTATVNVAAGEIVHLIFSNGLVQSSPVINSCATASFTENFSTGALGVPGPALTGLTDYHWGVTNAATNGYYLVTGRSEDAGYGVAQGYQNLRDHTSGNGQDRFLFINAGYQPSVFYRRRFTGLLTGATYKMSYWVLNATAQSGTPIGGTSTIIPPNIEAQVVDPSNGSLLGNNNSGNITTYGVWMQKEITFTATTSDVDLLLRNNSIGGSGNDLGIDDIVFRLVAPVTPTVSIIPATNCTSSASIQITAPLGANYEYSLDGGTYQSAAVFSGIAPGNHTVTARFQNVTTCVSTIASVTVNPGVCGNVFVDANGGVTPTDGVLYTAGGLWVNVYNGAGNFVTSAQVQPNGSYTVTGGLTPGNYQLQLSGTQATAGSVMPPTAALTGSYQNVSSATGTNNTAIDVNTINGIIPLTMAATVVSNVDFGINVPHPVAINDTASTPMNTPLNSTVTANDTCRLGPCSYNPLASDPPAHGTVTINNDGTYTYTPAPGFTGADTFSYVVCNSATPVACDTALVFITVTGPPAAVNDTASTTMNTPLNSTVTANDTCRMGPCNYSLLASDPPAHGTVTINGNGTYTYTPAPGFTGADTFSYVVCNSATPVACDTALVFITVTGPPAAVNDTASTTMNTPLNSTVTANDTCRMGPCNYSLLASDPPAHGTVTINGNGTYTYTPAPGFTGMDTFSYVVCNSATPVACDTALVFLTVTGPPAAVNDAASTTMNTPLNSTVTANDTCRMGPCSYSPLASDPPAHGTVTINGNGTYTYTPAPGFTGADTFSYVVCNSGTPVACDTALVFLTVTGPPAAVNDIASTTMNTPLNSTVTANDTCRMGPCSYSPLTSDPPAHGTVTINNDGTYTYTPSPGFTGMDTFSYVVCNSATPVACDTALVFLTVTGPPAAVNDAASTTMNTPLNNTVTANDTCRMGPCNYSPLTSDPPAHGTVTINNDGTYTYTPAPGFTGMDTFSYVVCNSATPVACDTALVFLTVSGPPVAVDDTARATMNTPLTGTVTANDTCRMGPCSYSPLASDPPAHGIVEVNSDGSFLYTPDPGFTGTDTFSYVVCNSGIPVACDTARVIIIVDFTLPVDLVSFTARTEGDCDVLLHWVTGTELNVDYFEPSWSADGSNFLPSGTVKAKGSGNSYSYLSRQGIKGRNYFRLKQVDRDGSYSYSGIVSANLDCEPARNIRVYPTVSNGHITIDGLLQGETVLVYNMSAVAVQEAKAEGPAVQLNLSYVAQGSYVVIVVTRSGERLHYKIVKK